LECGVGLAGASGHDQQHALLALGNGRDGAIDGLQLVVARRLAGGVLRGCDLLDLGRPAFPGAIALPEFGRRRELVQRQIGFEHAAGQGGVAEHEAVAIAGEAEGHVEQLRVLDGLRHAGAHRMLVVLGLDDGQRQIGLVEQRVVGTQNRADVASGLLAPHHDAAGAQRELPVDLRHAIPARLLHGGPDVLLTDIALGELLLVHGAPWRRDGSWRELCCAEARDRIGRAERRRGTV
jgi:hypothetical protein